MDKRSGRRVKGARTTVRKKTVGSLLEKAYLAKKAEGLAEGTLNRYKHSHNLLLQFLDLKKVGRDLDDLTVDICREFVNWLLEERTSFDGHPFKPESSKVKGVSPRYANDLLKALRTSFRVLVNDEIIDYNPFESVKNIKYPEKLIDVLTIDELKALLSAPKQRDYASFRDYVVMHVLIDTMARTGEIVSLRKSDINLQSKEIILRPEVVKTRVGRIIPIQDRTVRLLRELLAEVSDFESEYVFLANYGEPLTTNHFRLRLKKHAKAAGIKKNIYPHLLRHSAATIYLEGGGNLRYLQALLGHTDQRMTSRYTHLSRSSIAENHDKFSAINQVVGKLNKNRKIKR